MLDSQQMCGMPGDSQQGPDSRQGPATCASQWLAVVRSGRVNNVAFIQRVLQPDPYLRLMGKWRLGNSFQWIRAYMRHTHRLGSPGTHTHYPKSH